MPKPRAGVVRRLCLRKSADPLVRQARSFTRRLFSLPSQGTAESRQSAQCGTARAATRRARRRAQRSGRSPDTGTPPGWERPATWLRSGPQSCWRRPETAVMRRRPERPGDWRFSSQNSSQNLPRKNTPRSGHQTGPVARQGPAPRSCDLLLFVAAALGCLPWQMGSMLAVQARPLGATFNELPRI